MPRFDAAFAFLSPISDIFIAFPDAAFHDARFSFADFAIFLMMPCHTPLLMLLPLC